MEPRSAEALTALGGDPTGFVARTLQPSMADQADLVLTMTRRQRRTVLSQAPRALRHTFTLPEAVALLGSADTAGLDLIPLRRRASELATRLNAGRAWRRGEEADDVFDPIGQPASVHAQVAARIARKLEPLAEILFADDRSSGAWAPPPVPARRPAVPPLPMPAR
jgi:protein-tyrosine phosphatase